MGSTKKCTCCNEEKPTSAFYLVNLKSETLRSICKACNYNKKQKWREENRDRARLTTAMAYRKNRVEICRQKRARYSANREAMCFVAAKKREASPEKTRARAAISNGVYSGKVIRPDQCTHCGIKCTPEAHHFSYHEEHRLHVIWLCGYCHGDVHSRRAKQQGRLL